MLNSQEHADLRNTVARFVDQEINPNIDEWEAAKIFPAKELFKKLGNLGLLGISKPEAYGGMGLDYSFSVAFAEELGRTHCGGIPMAIGVQTDMATPALARFGSDELRRDFLAPAIAGDMVASIGVSEPGAGSDVAGLKTTARKDGGDYVINGTKMWITNGMQNDWICLLANTSDGAPHKNKSMIIVPMDTKGVERARKIDKMGMNGSDTAQIFFDEVRVPQRYLVGQEGMGFSMQMQQFQEERMFGAAMGLKGMELVVQATIDYTRERKAFGQSLLGNQVIHFRLAELSSWHPCASSRWGGWPERSPIPACSIGVAWDSRQSPSCRVSTGTTD
jgi:citronellyl-CoA dehydrogenase